MCGEITVSHYLKDFLTSEFGLPGSRVHVIHRWRDIEEICRAAAHVVRRDREEPVFGCVARLDWMKDYNTVLRAFAQCTRTLRQSRLLIVGDGHDRARLEGLASELGIRDRVDFVGHRSDVPELLGKMDIFVFATSETEGFGNAMIEAMAAGVPVIAPRVGPTVEVLNNGSVGVIVPPGDADAMAAAMASLWRDERGRLDLRVRAMQWVRENFTEEVVAPKLFALIYGPGRSPTKHPRRSKLRPSS